MARVNYAGTPQQVQLILRQLMLSLAGKSPDAWGVATGIQLRCANTLLSKIQQAFLVKSRGGTGEDGIKWERLKPETIAQRRTTAGERKAAGLTKANKFRGLLTADEDKRWRGYFSSKKAQLMAKHGLSQRQAEETAAKFAWAMLKKEGAKTKIGLFGGRLVDTLRDTGELFRSFAAGKEDKPSGADGQICTAFQGVITVGTNKKSWHHRGRPGKLPSRPFWPLDGHLPQAWWDAINKTLTRGLMTALVQVLTSGVKP